MRKIVVFAAFVLGVSFATYAQETFVMSNSQTDFQKGMACFDERKFGVAIQYFQRFLTSGNATESLSEKAEYYIVSSQFALREKNFVNEAQQFLAKNPYSPMRGRVCYMIGRSYYDQEQYEQAVTWYNQTRAKQLNEKEALDYSFTKAYAYLSLENYAEAHPIFATLSAQQTPYELDARYYSAYCDFCLKNYETAEEEFFAMSQQGKYAEPAAYYLLQIYDQRGEYEKAQETGKQLIKQFPSSRYNSEAYRILGEIAFRGEAFSEAVDYLKKYEKNQTKVQRTTMYMLGVAYYEIANYQNAVNYLSKVTSENDSLAQNAYLHIGNSYLKINNIQNAKMAYQAAAASSFDKEVQETAAFNHALAAYQSGAPFGEGIALFEKFIENYPKSVYLDEIYTHMANMFMTEKDYAAAYASIKKIKTSNEQIKRAKENALFQLGKAEFANAKYADALNYFSLAIEEFSATSFSAQALLWRGETYYQLGKYEKSRTDISAFLAAKQAKPADDILKAKYTVAYGLFASENYAEALDWFLQCLQTKNIAENSLYPDILSRTADCYFHGRNLDLARENYTKVPSTAACSDYAAFQNGFILGLQKKYAEKISVLENLIATTPQSDFADDALYEIGRAYVLQNNNESAIATYEKVLSDYPKTAVARKSALEKGMLLTNMLKTDEAIAAYKNVVSLYPNSDEAKTAIESLKMLYVEQNDVETYLAYVKEVEAATSVVLTKTHEDSLKFVAAERLFVKANYAEAATAFENYLETYCQKQTTNCISAVYYLAESYYQTDKKAESLTEFDKLTHLEGNPYFAEALSRASQLAYDLKKTAEALNYFEQLYKVAENKTTKNDAHFGMLRCYYLLNNSEKVIQTADNLLKNSQLSAAKVRETRYCRAKSHIAVEHDSLALNDLKELSSDLHYEMGTEAKFLYAEYFYKNGQYTSAQTEIFDLVQKNTPYPYWLARSFVLLADTYVAQEDDFQAKQYLLSLQENYKASDEVAEMVRQRLEAIAAREKEKVY